MSRERFHYAAGVLKSTQIVFSIIFLSGCISTHSRVLPKAMPATTDLSQTPSVVTLEISTSGKNRVEDHHLSDKNDNSIRSIYSDSFWTSKYFKKPSDSRPADYKVSVHVLERTSPTSGGSFFMVLMSIMTIAVIPMWSDADIFVDYTIKNKCEKIIAHGRIVEHFNFAAQFPLLLFAMPFTDCYFSSCEKAHKKIADDLAIKVQSDITKIKGDSKTAECGKSSSSQPTAPASQPL